MEDKKYTEEEVITILRAFHLDVLDGVYSLERLMWCNKWINENIKTINE